MPQAPDSAVIDALLDTLLEDLRKPEARKLLIEARAAFRRRVPFHLRSFAATFLLLQAVREGNPKNAQARKKGKTTNSASREDSTPSKNVVRQSGNRDSFLDAPPSKAGESPVAFESKPRYKGEGVTVFFGMGKRQRLYARILVRILEENGSLASNEIGAIRTFDNYTFVDIDPEKADELIARLAKFEFKGRPLICNRAKKRGEELENKVD